ncbi:hypothetical protein GCM10020000_03220 [Streptomyces olivoverticillatus]
MPTERPSTLLNFWERLRPKARISVAKASSHGAAAPNDDPGNISSRPAPTPPPIRLAAVSAFVDVAPIGVSSRRYTHALATAPGTRAIRDNAFAVTGDSPNATRAGSATNVPPPPMALSAPAATPVSRTSNISITRRASPRAPRAHNAQSMYPA